MPYNYDFTDTPEYTGSKLPVGMFNATVVGVERRRSEGSGNDYDEWTFEVSDGEYERERIKGRTSLSPKALGMTRNTLRAIFQQPISSGFQFDEEDAIGRPVRIKTRMGSWKGEDRIEVDRILPPIGGADFRPGSVESEAAEPVAAAEGSSSKRKGRSNGLFSDDE